MKITPARTQLFATTMLIVTLLGLLAGCGSGGGSKIEPLGPAGGGHTAVGPGGPRGAATAK